MFARTKQVPRHDALDGEVSPRAMNVTNAYWIAMLAASAFGTNLGDLWGEIVFPGLVSSLASLLAICAISVGYDRRTAARTEVGYWAAIVVMRAAATNLADILTHDLALGYMLVSVVLWLLTLAAARFTLPDPDRGGSPRVDGGYWVAMFIAGLFGTVAGDLIHHTIGLYTASVVLCAALAMLIAVRQASAPASVLLYWSIIMVERCAGTAVGDALASRRAVALGVPLASLCTGILFLISLWMRTRIEDRSNVTTPPDAPPLRIDVS